jgi:hypothetical protein
VSLQLNLCHQVVKVVGIINILEDVVVRFCGVYLLLSQYTGYTVDGQINKVYSERAVHFLWWRVSFDCYYC